MELLQHLRSIEKKHAKLEIEETKNLEIIERYEKHKKMENMRYLINIVCLLVHDSKYVASITNFLIKLKAIKSYMKNV